MSRREHYLLNTKYYGMPTPGATSEENEFPHYGDGDVLILVTPSRLYQLHSAILRRTSPTFVALLDEEPAVELSKNARKKGVNIKYRLHLTENANAGTREGGVQSPAHVLRRIPLNDNGSVEGDHPALLGDANENGRVIPQFVLAWEQVLGAYYNRPIDIGENDRDGIDFVLESAGHVLSVAEYLKNPTLVTRPIEASLLSLSQVLHRSIASNPAPWLDFSYRLRSKTLWKEALIHGAGRYHSAEIQTALRENDLYPDVVVILSEKAALLKTLSQRTQNNLLSYYPEALQRTKTVGRADRDSIGRASYANDIMQWLGLTVWRHWLAQQVCADATHHAADMGFAFFKVIARAGEAYLDRNQLRQFHDYFPMSPKGESVVENRVSELKQEGQAMVRKALENHSYLDVERWPAGHMTCTWVGPEDYPWERAARAAEAERERESARGTVEPSEFGGEMVVDGLGSGEGE